MDKLEDSTTVVSRNHFDIEIDGKTYHITAPVLSVEDPEDGKIYSLPVHHNASISIADC